MAYKLIKDIQDKIYKIGDIIPDSLGERLHKMYKLGHTYQPHVEIVKDEPSLIVEEEEKPVENIVKEESSEVVIDEVKPVEPEPKPKNKFVKRKKKK